MILARTLTKSQLGIWALFLIVTTVFEATKSALLKNAHIRFVSGSLTGDDKTIIASSSLLINSTLTILFIFFLVIGAKWLGILLNAGEELPAMLKWFIPGLIFMVLFSHFEAIQQSHFDFKGVFAGYITRQFSFFLMITMHYFTGNEITLNLLAIYLSLSIGLGVIVIFLYSRKYLHFKFNPTKIWTKKIISYGGFIFGSGLISNIFSNLDQILTANFISPSLVANYNVATRINGFIDMPTYSASEIIFPKMSEANAREGVERVKYLFEKMVSIIIALIIPIAIFVVIFAKQIITIIAGAQYTESAPILQLYMVASILGPFQNQAANTLNSTGKPGLSLILNAISLIVKFTLTYLCLLYFGFYGAAIGTIITAFISFFMWYFVIKKEAGVTLHPILQYSLGFYRKNYQLIRKALSKK